MTPKIKLSKYFLFISILSLVAMLVFIVQSGYSKIMISSVRDDAQSYKSQIIDTTINTDVLDKIEQRQEFDYQSFGQVQPAATINENSPPQN